MLEQFEESHGRGGLLLAVCYHEVVDEGMPYFVQVYIEAVRPGSVSVCYVHATTAEACFAASMIRLTMHTS